MHSHGHHYLGGRVGAMIFRSRHLTCTIPFRGFWNISLTRVPQRLMQGAVSRRISNPDISPPVVVKTHWLAQGKIANQQPLTITSDRRAMDQPAFKSAPCRRADRKTLANWDASRETTKPPSRQPNRQARKGAQTFLCLCNRHLSHPRY